MKSKDNDACAMGLELKDVCKSFGTKEAVKHLSLTID